MVSVIKTEATVTTTFGKIIDFAAAVCRAWSPAFYISITRDGKKEFNRDRFDSWLNLNIKEFNLNMLYPDDRCAARVKSGLNKGLRCSKKSKKKVEVKKNEDGDEYEEEIDTGLCGVHKNCIDKDVIDENYTKIIYGGEEPRKKESKFVSRVKNKLVRVPQPFITGEEIPEEEFMEVFKKLCQRVNKVELDGIKTNNKIKYLEGYIDKVSGSKGIKDLYNNEIAVEVSEKYCEMEGYQPPKRNEVPRKLIFEEEAPQEVLDRIKKRKDDYQEMMLDKLAQKAKEIINEEEAGKVEQKLKEEIKNLNENEVPEPTIQDIVDGTRTVWLGPDAPLRLSKKLGDKMVFTTGVGSSDAPTNNIAQDFDNQLVRDPKIREDDRSFADDNLYDLKKKRAYMPWKDPSVDYLQDPFAQVNVKALDNGENATWVEYYKYWMYVRDEYMISIRKWERLVNGFKEHGTAYEKIDEYRSMLDACDGLESTHKYVMNMLEDISTKFGVRPNSKAQLLQGISRLDKLLKIMTNSHNKIRPNAELKKLEKQSESEWIEAVKKEKGLI
ncbi:hypothetical protein GGI07_005877 [Coemansia sp. Benny D115]|nr:hypothetical protein GGI07_005877 [Coemansia sp. Benny D115]